MAVAFPDTRINRALTEQYLRIALIDGPLALLCMTGQAGSPSAVTCCHDGRTVRVKPLGSYRFGFGLTRPRSVPLGLIHGWRVYRDPDNPPLGIYPASARGRPPAAARLAVCSK